MTTLKLYPEHSESKSLRSYMSSSLTGFPNLIPADEYKVRESVLALNKDIKELCQKSGVVLYLPQESSNPASSHDDGLNPDEVYLLDRWRIAESNFMILNADNLSFGVGQEMEIANSIGIPTIIFYQEGKKISRMILGAPCIFIPDGFDKDDSYIIYKDLPDLFNKLSDRIEILKTSLSFKEEVISSAGESFSKKLKDKRESLHLSLDKFSQLTGFSVSFLRLLETEKHYFDKLALEKNLNNKVFSKISPNKFTNPGLFVLEILSKAMNIELHQLLPSTPQINTYAHLEIYKEALLETNPNITQLFRINESLDFEFQRKAAAFDGDIKLTKDYFVSKIKGIQENG